MFELYNQADQSNETRTTLSCDIHDKDDSFIIEFIQAEFSDFNKWQKPKVLTDMIVTRLTLPEIYSHISLKGQLASYISKNIEPEFSIIDEFEELAKFKQRIVISLPTQTYPTRKGIPTNARVVKDTHLPLIVKINGKDVSDAFLDFGDFGANAVKTAYKALVKGKIPESKNDIFYIDGVKSLYEELINDEMGK